MTATRMLEHADTIHTLALKFARRIDRTPPSHLEEQIIHALRLIGPPEDVVVALRAARHIDQATGNYSVTDRFTRRHAAALACGRSLDKSRYLVTLDITADALILDYGYHRSHIEPVDHELRHIDDLKRYLVNDAPPADELLRRYRRTLIDVAAVLLP